MVEPMQRQFSNPTAPPVDVAINAADGPRCPNANPGLDRSSYVPCNCYQCSLRNRSVWVRVADRFNMPVMDVQTRVRYGLESRFGRVEDVNHAPGVKQHPIAANFIVRYALTIISNASYDEI